VTSTVTEVTARVIESKSASAGAGAVAVVLLMVLLVQQEFFRMSGGSHAAGRRSAYRLATWPLLGAFSVVVVTRLADVLHTS
jgi:hypothetical protein